MSVMTSINDPASSSVNKTGNSNNSVGAGSSAQDLQDSFLTLLVAQLKNQDPTNPMDNSQLTTQLAQINTVSGIEKLNTTLGSISGQINNGQSVQATSMIGHGVMVPGGSILVGSDKDKVSTTPFGLELERASDTTTVTISDATGKAVKTINIGAQTAGVHSYTWDGTQDDGTPAPDGNYSFSINASSNGEQMVATKLNYAMVAGVINDAKGPLLDLGVRGTSTLGDVRQILG